ncbi:MAG TPA: DUF3168 domain-containing protein [Edaphobacter sp.]|nr:DUF3168 domain-containing protein [Edaphobacter sp.]
MIETLFLNVLKSQAPVTALVADRIWPIELPDECPLPAIEYMFVGGSPDPTFDTNGSRRLRVEVNCWGTSYGAATHLREVVRLALDGYQDDSMTIFGIQPLDFFDKDSRQYRATYEFYVFTTL